MRINKGARLLRRFQIMSLSIKRRNKDCDSLEQGINAPPFLAGANTLSVRRATAGARLPGDGICRDERRAVSLRSSANR